MEQINNEQNKKKKKSQTHNFVKNIYQKQAVDYNFKLRILEMKSDL